MRENPEKLALLRPDFIEPKPEPRPVSRRADIHAVADGLLSGRCFLIRDEYPTGLKVLSLLRERVFGGQDAGGGSSTSQGNSTKSGACSDNGSGSDSDNDGGGGDPAEVQPGDDFSAYRRKRSEYREASSRLLVPVKENRIALKKAPAIGWLDELYPDASDFLLPFPQIQGLNSSWQWFLKGVRFPVLRHEIYPWYGTYFPTRFDHLHLFDEWLKAYTGSKTGAMDIGTGCGVLAFMLLERGFEHVLATDIHPNAIMTVRENARHQGVDGRMDARVSDLFEAGFLGGYGRRPDLIVCNPPWLPSETAQDTAMLDKAIYHTPGFFDRLFSGADLFLNENGRLVILFSNLGLSQGVQVRHPVEEELQDNIRFRKVRMLRRKVAPPSQKTRRRDHRKEEYVELWELEACPARQPIRRTL